MSALPFLIKKEFISFRRNKFLPRLVFLFPIVIMLIVPLVANMEVKNVNVAVVNHDHSLVSQRMISHLQASPNLRVRLITENYQQALLQLEDNRINIIVKKGQRDVIKNFAAAQGNMSWPRSRKRSKKIV